MDGSQVRILVVLWVFVSVVLCGGLLVTVLRDVIWCRHSWPSCSESLEVEDTDWDDDDGGDSGGNDDDDDSDDSGDDDGHRVLLIQQCFAIQLCFLQP